MRDFESERLERLAGREDQLEFAIGGETFKLLPSVPPETMAAFDEMAGGSAADTVKGFDKFMGLVMSEADHARWLKVRKEASPPLSLHDIESVVFWALEQISGRPTGASSSSGRGRERQAVTSRAG